MTQKTALIAGATGLVGSYLLKLLLENDAYARILSLTRRASGLSHPKLEEIITDFDDLEKLGEKFESDHVFCCLGTTMKKAGSREAFYKVDYEYPLKLASISRARGAKHFLLVSAQGANPKSVFFYNRVKGQLEDAISKIGFEYYTVIRPALILGDRLEKRAFEEIGKFLISNLDFMLSGSFRKFKGVQASDIARKMMKAASENSKNWQIIKSEEIRS